MRWFAQVLDQLRARLALSLAIALIPVVVYNLALAYRGYLEAEQRGWDNVRRLAIVASTSQNALIEGTHRILVGLSEQPLVRAAAITDGRSAPARDCSRVMARILTTFEEYSDLVVIDENGTVTCSAVDRAIGLNIADTPWFQEVKRTGALSLGYFTLSRETAEPIISMVVPLRSADQKLVGAILVGIRLPWLGSLARKNGLPPEGVVYLLDSKGTVMTSSDQFLTAPEPGQGIVGADRPPQERAHPGAEHLQAVAKRAATDFVEVGKDGVTRLFSAADLRNGSLFIVFGLPQRTAMSWSHAQTMLIVFGPVVMLLLAIGTAAIGGELLVSRSVKRLLGVVNAYGRDELSAKADLRRSPREIRQFAEAFSSMAERIVARESELKRTVEQKENLLREVHHRVKNNLQVVSSFLNLQSRSVGDDTARRALTEARSRVRTLALVHDHLHDGGAGLFVDFAAYVDSLVDQLSRMHDLPSRGIAITTEIEPIDLPQAGAVAVALFITEAVTNAIDHGFPAPRGGTIVVRLVRPDPDHARLTITDDGVGIGNSTPDGASGHSGIGTSLMRAFANQLDGEVAFEHDAGTKVTLTFALPRDEVVEAKTESDG